jgi:hypothetical protein
MDVRLITGTLPADSEFDPSFHHHVGRMLTVWCRSGSEWDLVQADEPENPYRGWISVPWPQPAGAT